jgi:hypothetical protein
MAIVSSISETGSTLPKTSSCTSILHPTVEIPRRHTSSRSQQIESCTTPWWLWWNILSLDAPTVAVVWSFVFANASGVRLRPADPIILALTVWVIYISDRLLDGWVIKNCSSLEERHLFCARHRGALAWLVVLAAATVLWMTAEYLLPKEAGAGMKLAAIVGAYMASIHAGRASMARFVPKELTVGILFAAGITLPVWSQTLRLSRDMSVSIVLFALLCFLNCLAIEYWEGRPLRHGCGQMWHRSDARNKSRINWIAGGLVTAALAALLVRLSQGLPGCELWAVSLAALLTLILNRQTGRISVSALRVLADAALVVAGLVALMTQV